MSGATALQEMTQRHAGVLAELTGIFMEAVRQCGADVAQAQTPEAKTEAYARLSPLGRAVRQCLALESRMTREALKDIQAAERVRLTAEQEAAEAREKHRQAQRSARKAPVWNRVLRTLEDIFPEDDEDSTELGDRYEDLRTRLDDETFEAEFAHLPYEEVVRIVHRDLDLPEPQFTSQDTVRALIWAAQWGHAQGHAPEQASPQTPPETPDPETPESTPDPDPPPEPYVRYSSG